MVVSAAQAQNKGLIYFSGRNWLHILTCRGQFAYSSSNFQKRSWSFKGVYWGTPRVKARLEPKFSKSRRKSTENLYFWRKLGQNIKICFRHRQKAHSCAKPRLLTCWSSKSAQRPRGSELEEPKKLTGWTLDRQLLICGGQNPLIGLWCNFAQGRSHSCQFW